MVSIHGPLGYEPNTLTTAPLRSCKDEKSKYALMAGKRPCASLMWNTSPTTHDIHMDLPKIGDSGVTTGPCGLMDKALVFGTKDCRFESCQGHLCLVVANSKIRRQPNNRLCMPCRLVKP